ncbi:glycosyltransferase family 4 protein [Elstera cyanobacteriorum]|uniref:glycosyltransferase family 4 protein n=1 Tax=Elstera cyanobacteriorum TaxID=2022747 RepID=UPI002354CFD4|nr:glycosyltransferase family 4 protein [Elstera cyanobacteriorum]MCK6442358.1 glycosyltransferase family 4 protein [Elstera cyanobacteriorum]
MELGLAWPLSTQTGWGQVGFNMALQMLRLGSVRPLLLEPPEDLAIHGLHLWTLLPLELERRARTDGVNGKGADWPFPVMHPLGNHFGGTGSRHRHRGAKNIGRMVFEDTELTAADRRDIPAYDCFLTPSRWNADLLTAAGVPDVRMVHEGIDDSIFFPAPRQGLCPGRFIVFSGGKLEFRKGQDIVVAAFKIFQRRHPEALLAVNWQNFWPQLAADIHLAGNVQTAPGLDQNGRLALGDWLIREGLPEDSFVDLGMIPHHMMAQVMREAHVAVFPNRAEGATNLVALECMAVNVPVILSANTGHLDLMMGSEPTCHALTHQSRVKTAPGMAGLDGWGESSVEDVVQALEKIYTDTGYARSIARNGTELAQSRSWQNQTKLVLDSLADLLD